MKIVLTTFIIFLSLTVNAQELLPKSTTIPCCNNKYHLSNDPITNREYISYLVWLNKTYLEDDKLIIAAIPGFQVKYVNEFYVNNIDSIIVKHTIWGDRYISYNRILSNYDVIVNNTKPFVKNYLFNPRYLDYPVVGVTQVQALNFLKWLSDRYNEHQLIKHKAFRFDRYQLYENCFVTESYLCRMYQGIKDRSKLNDFVKWDEGYFLPAFRLPSQYELNQIPKSTVALRKYKKNKLKFLEPWLIDLKRNGDKFTVQLNRFSEKIIVQAPFFGYQNKRVKFDINYISHKELTLNSQENTEEEDYLKLLSDLGFPEISKSNHLDSDGNELVKNEYGSMGYIIIDTKNKEEFVYIDNYITGNKIFNGFENLKEYFNIPLSYEQTNEVKPFRFIFAVP